MAPSDRCSGGGKRFSHPLCRRATSSVLPPMMFYFSEKLQSLSSSLKKIGKSRPGRYLIALCFFSAALWARFALGDVLPSKGFPFLTFFPAVILSAYFVGLWPGVMVSLLSIFSAWYFFIEPSGSIAQTSFPDRIALGFFTIVLLVDCVIVHVTGKQIGRAHV